MIKYFNIFFNHYLSEVAYKIKMYLILYPDLNEHENKKIWSKVAGVPLDKFFKSQYINGRSAKKTIPYGIGTIIISSRAYKEIIIRWLELKKKR